MTSSFRLLRMWIGARIKLLLRNPRAAFFTFAFPLLFLVLFNAINGNVKVPTADGKISFIQFFTPSIAVFGLIVGTYMNPIVGLALVRESEIMKRLRTSPTPMWTYLSGWLIAAMVVGVLSVIFMIVVGMLAFGFDVRVSLLPAALVTIILGALCAAALGIAMSSFVRSSATAPMLANFTMLPLTFISGIFYPMHGAPDWLVDIAKVFPLYYIVDAFGACFSPRTTGTGFILKDLLIIAAWIAVGLAFATFRYQRENRSAFARAGARPTNV